MFAEFRFEAICFRKKCNAVISPNFVPEAPGFGHVLRILAHESLVATSRRTVTCAKRQKKNCSSADPSNHSWLVLNTHAGSRAVRARHSHQGNSTYSQISSLVGFTLGPFETVRGNRTLLSRGRMPSTRELFAPQGSIRRPNVLAQMLALSIFGIGR
jgi:hypothetical protein